jgi:hypothetical protein
MAAVKTRLFNIRISEERHKQFKKYAESVNSSMGGLLLDYIDALVKGDVKPVGVERETTNRMMGMEDPLEAVRNQYKPGRDF